MVQTKMEKALSAAIKHLETCIAASSGNDDKTVSDSLWSASAETEYALFMLSIKLGEKAENATWKQQVPSKQVFEFLPSLRSALQLLQNAKILAEAGNLEKGHEKGWTARNLLLEAWGFLRKRETKGK